MLLFIIVLLPFTALSQVVIDTMYFDRNWEQTAKEQAHYYRIISTDTAGEFRFLVHDFFPSGRIQMTGTYKSIRPDNKDGHFIYYFETGQKQMDCHYRDNMYHGLCQEWFESGQMKVSQFFANDLLDGKFASWREDGTPRLQAHYSMGEKHGEFISYYSNGQQARRDIYENDKLVEGKCFTQKGRPTAYFPYIKMPEFQGGREGLLRYLRDELVYPPEARRRRYTGSVVVLFTVDESGMIRGPSIANGDIESFNTEALRIVSEMPPWIPGEIDGIPSPIQVSIPIDFSPY
jgi:TonB family protein